MTLTYKRCFHTAFIAMLLCATASAQRITKNVEYTKLGGGASGDVYEAAGAGPFPAIVYIHGGSWRSGNKDDFRKLASDLALQGYVGFSIDYDLHPHSFPLSWQQSRDAVSFLRSHAAEYHVDPNKIVVAGASAGGELAALLALEPNGPAGEKQTDASSAKVAAAVILNGVFNLNSSVGVITRYLGAKCQAAQAECDDASPLRHVHAGAPPFFVGHGTADHTVPYSEAQIFAEALQKDNVPVTFYAAQGGPHMYFTKSEFYGPNLTALEAFLEKTLPQH
jgi:acetyl esterase/lipase